MSTQSDASKQDSLVTELNSAADKFTKAARGALNRANDAGNDLFQELIKTGESLRAKAESKIGERNVDQWRVRLAHTLGLPTRDEMENLDKKLNRISRKVNKLAREQKANG